MKKDIIDWKNVIIKIIYNNNLIFYVSYIKILIGNRKVNKYGKKLIVCVHNSCRSQIAEVLGKKFMNDKYEFYSCGTKLKP